MASLEQIEIFSRKSKDYARRYDAEIQKELNTQRALESEIIQKTNSFCPLEQLKDRTVRAEDVQRALKDGFDSGEILKALMCLNNANFIFPKSAENMGSNFKVRQYLENLKQIGGESAEGYAMLGSVKTSPGTSKDVGKDLFVVKAPRIIDANLRANQIHEYFVGAFGTNTLRDRIPNFSFILGFFQCSPPYIDSQAYTHNGSISQQDLKDRRALTFCQNDISENKVNYLLYENVDNSVTLKEYIINGCTYEQYLNIFVQVILALDLAYRSIGFTHYDLHNENILVRELPEEILIPYEVDETGTVQYLRTRHVATIIDFGRSHIEYEGKHYGYALIEGGIYPNKSYPMYDIFKLLMFSLSAAAFGNNDIRNYIGLTDDQIAEKGKFANPDVFQNIKELISYFVYDIPRNNVTNYLITVSDYLIQTRKFFYSLPYSPQFNIRPVKFYRDAVLTVYSGVIGNFLSSEAPSPDKLYGCANKGTCQDLKNAILKYSKPDSNYIDDPYIFYEMFVESRQRISSVSLETLITAGQSKYYQYIHQLRMDRNKFSDEYNEITKGYTIVSLEKGAPDNVKFQPTFLDMYRRFIAKSVKLVDTLTSIAQIELIIKTLNEIYPQEAQQIIPGVNYRYNDISKMEFDPIRQSITGLNEVVFSIKRDVNYIRGLNQAEILQVNRDTIWLFQKMPTLVAAISEL